jgi:hypothetical protein
MMNEVMCFVVYLSGATEVPGPGDAEGYGVAAITIDPTTNTITFDATVAEIMLPAAMAHIHEGEAGVSGPVVVNANGAPDAQGVQFSTSDVLDPAVVQAILSNPAGYYYNIHTEEFPDGAVRGQLAATDMSMEMPNDGEMSATMEATADATASN